MKIAILAPSHKSFISQFLKNIEPQDLPEGYFGAPFIGILIKELLNQGHEIIAVTTTVSKNRNYEISEYSNENFHWVVIPARKRSIRPNGYKLGRILDFFAFERNQIKKIIQKYDPDFVHAHWSYEFAGAIKNNKIPHLITIHDNPYQVLKYMTNFYRFGRLLMSEWVMHNTKFASTVSPYMQQYAAKRCKELRIIPNPVQVNLLQADILNSIELKIPYLKTNPKLIMVLNGWDKLKNGRKGLIAFKKIKEKIPGASLHLVGNETGLNERAWKDAKHLDLNDVVFHGTISHSMLLSELKSFHLMLHPSLEESFGVVLIEAMANSVPVIGGKDSGAVPWVVNNNRLLADVNDVNDIVNKSLRLLSNTDDYKNAVIEGYNNVTKRFSAEAVVRQYEAYYNSIKTRMQ